MMISFSIYGLLGILASTLAVYDRNRDCVSERYIPDTPNRIYGFSANDVTQLYPDVESFMQVFKQYKFTCNGWLKGVVLYPAQPTIKNLNVAIFRIDPQDGLLVMVNSSVIRDVVPPFANRGWFFYELPKPIFGHAGDFVGVYYDNWRTLQSDLTLRTFDSNSMPNSRAGIADDTLVFKLDGRLSAPGASMDISTAVIRRRLPALAVLITGNQPTIPTPTSPLPAGIARQCALDILPDDINCATTMRRFRFSPNQGRCYEFLGCDTMSTSNNFPNARDCLANCVWPYTTTSSPLSSRFPGAAAVDSRCSEQLTILDTTECSAPSAERWNFNPFYRQCRPFLGCERLSGNNWDSEYQCQTACVQGNSTETGAGDSRCTSDATLGQWLCLYKEPRFYWDPTTSSCKQFFGCPYRNNMGYPIGNNFGSYSSCISACSTPMSTTTTQASPGQ